LNSAAAIDAVADALTTFVTTQNFDGLDVDWQYPSSDDKVSFKLTKISVEKKNTLHFLSPGNPILHILKTSNLIVAVKKYVILIGGVFKFFGSSKKTLGKTEENFDCFCFCKQTDRNASVQYKKYVKVSFSSFSN